MADIVSTLVVKQTDTHLVVQLNGASDGTGEAAVKKIDRSTYAAADGATPTHLDLESVLWCVQGFPYVTLLWDKATDEVIGNFAGSGYQDYKMEGELRGKKLVTGAGGLRDPSTNGGSADHGDILLTSPAAATTGSYLFILVFRKRNTGE